MNLPNQALTNVFSKALIVNSNAPRYARANFVDLVSATMLSKSFQRAIKAAENLFGVTDEDKVITRKIKHAKKAKGKVKITKHAKKHAKRAAAPVDPNAPKPLRGRPKGSKNKPKVVETPIAETRPLVDPTDETEPNITLET